MRLAARGPYAPYGPLITTFSRLCAISSSYASTTLQEAAAWTIRHHANPNAAPPSTLLPEQMPLQLTDHARAAARISLWPEYAPTPLRSCPGLAQTLGVHSLHLKDETQRLGGVGSFKALGGAFAVEEMVRRSGTSACFATASAGNHGIGLAWGCRRLGVPCHVFLSTSVDEMQADRVRAYGGTVHRVDGTYEDSLAAAQRASEVNGWSIVQDVDWVGYERVPRDIFSGYTVLAGEIVDQLESDTAPPPTHVLVNAGVGGLASAVCTHLWARYGSERPRFITVEPSAADCLLHSARTGRMDQLPAERIASESTRQTGLDCKVPTALAWSVLESGANDFVAVPDEVVTPCIELLGSLSPEPIRAGESAVAGLGALLGACAQPQLASALGIGPSSRVALIVCEAAFDLHAP